MNKREQWLEDMKHKVQALWDLYAVLRLAGHKRRAKRTHTILKEKINALEEQTGCPWWEV